MHGSDLKKRHEEQPGGKLAQKRSGECEYFTKRAIFTSDIGLGDLTQPQKKT